MWMDNWVLNTPKSYWPLYKEKQIPALFRFFETQKTIVVLSSSNNPETEANTSECSKLNIPILRRKGGGGTVVLGPGCLILTLAFYAKDIFGNAKYFNLINNLWINALQEHVPQKMSQNGISDICIREKKIAGTSIFRKKNLLVYQGSMLIDVNLNQISQLLQHPSKEPEYRKGRDHSEFLTTLKNVGCKLNTIDLAEKCQKYFEAHIETHLQEEFFKIA